MLLNTVVLQRFPSKRPEEIKWDWQAVKLDNVKNYNWPKRFRWGVATAAHQGNKYIG